MGDMTHEEMMAFLQDVSGRQTVYMQQEANQLIIDLSGDRQIVFSADRGTVWLDDGRDTWQSR